MEDKNYLEGINWSEFDRGPKLPHQMTPAEFRAHPFTVHHGTINDYPAREISANYSGRSSEVNNLVFSGDRAQAADRAGITHLHGGYSGGNIHHYWAVPSQDEAKKVFYDDDVPEYHFQKIKDSTDEDAERVTTSSVTRHGSQFGYYRNAYEGAGVNESIDSPREQDRNYRGGALSIASYPQALKTHSQFVEHAIRSGKHNEVPAETMGHYVAGTLDTTPVSDPAFRRHRLGYTDVTSPHIDYKDPVWDSELANRISRSPKTNKELREDSEKFPQRYTPEDSEFYTDRRPIDIKRVRGLVNNGYAKHVAYSYRGLHL